MGNKFNGNTVFFKNASHSRLSFADVFSDVFKKHQKGDGATLFMAGTSLSTPKPDEMLKTWKKPWVFIRFFGGGMLTLILLYIMIAQGAVVYAIAPFAFLGASLMPLTILVFYWEMNIPRNIPIYEVIVMFFIGGSLSLIFTLILNQVIVTDGAEWAPLTEEPAKLLALYLFLRKKEYIYILNGILIGGAIGAGFAAIESTGYFLATGSLDNLILRGILSLGGHVIWAALYGGALARVKASNKLTVKYLTDKKFLIYFLCACALHFVWNNNYIYTFYIPIFVDVKFVVLIAIGWFLLFKMVKYGLQQILEVADEVSHYDENIMPKPIYALFGISGDYAGSNIPISVGNLIFGRDASICNLIFPESTQGISRRHCTLSFDGETVFLMDIGSSYGTFLDGGKKLLNNEKVVLNEGQRFYLSNIATTFELRRQLLSNSGGGNDVTNYRFNI